MDGLLILNRWLGRVAMTIAGISLLIMLGVTIVDIVLRYLFQLTGGGPTLPGSVELVDIFLLLSLLGAMASQVEKSQVVVEVFTQRLSDAAKTKLAGLFLLFFAVLGLVLAWQSFHEARTLSRVGQITQDLAIPMSWMSLAACFLFVVLGLRALIAGLESLVRGVDHAA